jgi:predicted ATPase
VGAAGTGKTRLAVEVAQHVADEFSDGTYFVDLAPITDPALLGTAIAQATEIREERGRPLLEVLKDNLASRRVLLLLDNFEQLLPAAPQLSELLEACPDLKLLTTSRSALRLRWENVMPVPPLAVPSLASPLGPDNLAQYAAVTLFVQRAQRVDPHFRLTDANAAAVAAICVRLDGLPLAIELAAARSRVLPPEALLSRLGRRLDVLAGSNQDQPVRQRTLRAALDWSYELLPGPEQVLFRRLAVFVGGFALGALAEVCDSDGRLGIDALEGVESLVDKSLLRQERGTTEGDEPRFGMLETIREYALERLAESGERELIRRRHAEYYLAGSAVPIAEMKMSQQTLWLRSLEAEHDNLRAALAWCLDAHEPELGLSAAGLLSWFWIVRGYVAEGRRQLTALMALAGPGPTALRAEALRVIGSLALHQTDYSGARALFEESLTIRRELGNSADLLSPLSSLGAVAMQQGHYATAEAYFEEALTIQQAIDDPVGVAESLNSLANLAHERGDLARARELYQRALVLQQAGGVHYREDVVLHNLGVVAQEQGERQEARQHFQDSVAIKRVLGDTPGLSLSLAKLGEVVSSLGDRTTAHHLLSESLALERDVGDRPGICRPKPIAAGTIRRRSSARVSARWRSWSPTA